jgi:hypothetical protein
VIDLSPEKEFLLRTHQQTCEGLSKEQAIELCQQLLEQLMLKDIVVLEMIKRKLL